MLKEIKEKIKKIILRKMYGDIGSHSEIPLKRICVNGAKNIFVGDFCSIGPDGYYEANSYGKIIICDGVIIAPRVTMLTRTHRFDNPDLEAIPYDKYYLTGDICIEEGVWIGQGAFILPGVKIGRGAVVGAGCVVAKAVPEYAVVVGNPAQIVRFREKIVFDKLLNEKKYIKRINAKKEYIQIKEKKINSNADRI